MTERSNFHENDLKHYKLKLGNAREDGKKIQVRWTSKNRAKKTTCKHLLEQVKKGEIKLSPEQIKVLEERLA